MAVVKQKLAAVSGNRESIEQAVLRCASAKDFYPEEPPQSVSTFRRMIAPGEANPFISLKNKTKELLDDVKSLSLPAKSGDSTCDTPIFADYKQYGEYLRSMEQRLIKKENECKEIQKKLDDNKILIEQLERLKNLNAPLGTLFDFEYIRIRFGYLPRENYDRFEVYIGSIQSAIFLPSTIDKDFVWGMYLTLRNTRAENDKVFATLGFKRVRLPASADGLPTESIQKLEAESSKLRSELETAKKIYYDYAADIYRELIDCEDYLLMQIKAFEIKKKLLMISDDNYSFYGWVNAKLLDEIQEDLRIIGVEVTEQAFDSGDISEPPVVLKNWRIFRPFQQFVEMYGLPSYNEFDPTPFVAMTYALFFGMMFGDVGQGAVLLLAGIFAKRVMKIRLGSIISIVGGFSVIFGFIFGSVFGNEDILIGFRPMENVNTVLITAVGIGVVMLTICSILNIANGIRQRNVEKLLFSPNGIAGLLFYWSLLLMMVSMLGFVNIGIPQGILKVTLIIGLLMIFLRTPLSKLIEGKKDWLPEKVGMSFVESFFELFEVFLSYITNTISFIRIGAFALSHASMMGVVFLIANQQTGFTRTAIIIGGNIIVMGLEGLVVSIQVLRLEFYELFSRFYDGDGRPVREYK